MTTEHKKDHDTTILAEKLSSGWEQFKRGKLISYRMIALILLAITGIGLYFYIRAERAVGESKTWAELESASTLTSLEDFARNNSNSTAGKVAELHAARYLLGPEGIEKLPEARDEGQRKTAIENIDKAREAMAKLADEFKSEPVLRAECYLGLAKAEIALIGITKDGKIEEFRGTVEKAADWLDKLAEAADGTPWGDDAKKMSAALKVPTSPMAEEIKRVQVGLYTSALRSQLPGDSQFPHGGSSGMSLPDIPGFPGGFSGGPISPGSMVPSFSAAPPAAVGPPPTGTAPISPAIAPLTPGGQPSSPVDPKPPSPPAAPPSTPSPPAAPPTIPIPVPTPAPAAPTPPGAPGGTTPAPVPPPMPPIPPKK